jgi:hypothetical protein
MTFGTFDEAADPRFETPEQLHRLPFDCTVAETRALSYHEAGHAVVAMTCGVVVHYATTEARYSDLGHVLHAPIGTMTIEDGVLITLAGPAAQRRFFPYLRWFSEDLEDHMGRHDTAQARGLLRVLYGSDNAMADGITEALARWRGRADRLVERHWPWIAAVARALEQRQRLSGDEIARLNPKRGRVQ